MSHTHSRGGALMVCCSLVTYLTREPPSDPIGDFISLLYCALLRNLPESHVTHIRRRGTISNQNACPPYTLSSPPPVTTSLPPPPLAQGGEYSEFAGHDISRRVAGGLSKAGGDRHSDATLLLDDLSLEGLDRFEQMTLRGWEDTFKARGYATVGRVVDPPAPRMFSRAELRAFDGRPAAHFPSAAVNRSETGDREGNKQAASGRGHLSSGRGVGGESGLSGGGDEDGVDKKKGMEEGAEGDGGSLSAPQPMPMPMPSGYASRPIYMGVRDKVFDVSFGGSEFYLEGGPYECLAGRDASRGERGGYADTRLKLLFILCVA